MTNVSSLLKKGYPNRAANALYDSLFFLLNSKVPGFSISKEDFNVLMPELIDSVTGAKGWDYKTEAPGDDVISSPSRARLIITINAPEELGLPHTVTATYAVGQDFEFIPPVVDGYLTDLPKVVGKMTTTDIHVPITYTEIPEEPVEPKFGTLVPKADTTGDKSGYSDSTLGPEILAVRIGGEYKVNTFYNDNDKTIESKHKDDKHVSLVPPSVPVLDEAWWPAAIIHAPEDMTDATQDVYDTTQARYLNLLTGEWINFSMGALRLTVEDEDDPEVQSIFWVPVTPETLRAPNGADGYTHHIVQVDWNHDGIFEQTFDISVIPEETVLKNKLKKELWPNREIKY